jgi:CTP:molybdopterin cytidylyltransferase MocA
MRAKHCCGAGQSATLAQVAVVTGAQTSSAGAEPPSQYNPEEHVAPPVQVGTQTAFTHSVPAAQGGYCTVSYGGAR